MMRLTWSNVKLSILHPKCSKCLRHLLGVWRPAVATKISIKLKGSSICLTLSNDLPWNKVSNFGLPSTHQNGMHSVNSNTQFQRSHSFPSIPKYHIISYINIPITSGSPFLRSLFNVVFMHLFQKSVEVVFDVFQVSRDIRIDGLQWQQQQQKNRSAKALTKQKCTTARYKLLA